MAISLGVLSSARSGNLATGFTSIATVTAAGGETSLTFSSIPATYTDLHIRGIARDTGAVHFAMMTMQMNADSGSNYAYHTLEANQTTVAATGNATQTSIGKLVSAGASSLASAFSNIVIDISDYTSTSKNKTIRAISSMDENSATASQGYIDITSGVWLSTSAITSIKILAGSTAFAAGTTFALYGIKGFA